MNTYSRRRNPWNGVRPAKPDKDPAKREAATRYHVLIAELAAKGQWDLRQDIIGLWLKGAALKHHPADTLRTIQGWVDDAMHPEWAIEARQDAADRLAFSRGQF
jgi:hypothetical protein